MSTILKVDTDGSKALLAKGEFGYDDFTGGNDVGRVYVGTGSANIGLAKREEVLSVDDDLGVHMSNVASPHNVTKAQVGLNNVDNVSDMNKPISTAVLAALNTKIETETVTSLDMNANILSYTDEAGVTKNIDLSMYLDDSNLSRLTSGTLDAVSGVATFLRDDGSSFTLDMSAFFDDTNVTVTDGLTSTSATDALSANQGRVLQAKIDALTTVVEW